MWGSSAVHAAARGITSHSTHEGATSRRTGPALVLLVGVAGATAVTVLPARLSSAEPPAAEVSRPALGEPTLSWAAFDSVEARAAALGRIVAAHLGGAGVPMPAVRVADIGGATGQFDPHTWTLELSSAVLARVSDRTSSELAVVAGVARHEARHAEQWFRMARLRAADGLSAPALSVEMGLPPEIASAAIGRPLLLAGPTAVEARLWWDSIYGPNGDHREVVIDRLHAAKTAYDEAARAYRQSPSAAAGEVLQAARQALGPAYRAYRDLPEEADAFAVQDRFLHGHGHTVAPAA